MVCIGPRTKQMVRCILKENHGREPWAECLQLRASSQALATNTGGAWTPGSESCSLTAAKPIFFPQSMCISVCMRGMGQTTDARLPEVRILPLLMWLSCLFNHEPSFPQLSNGEDGRGASTITPVCHIRDDSGHSPMAPVSLHHWDDGVSHYHARQQAWHVLVFEINLSSLYRCSTLVLWLYSMYTDTKYIQCRYFKGMDYTGEGWYS